MAGVVDEDVHTAELLDSGLDQTVTGGFIADVSGEDKDAATSLLNRGGRLLQRGRIAGRNHNRRPFSRRSAGQWPAQCHDCRQ